MQLRYFRQQQTVKLYYFWWMVLNHLQLETTGFYIESIDLKVILINVIKSQLVYMNLDTSVDNTGLNTYW